jgi:protein-tyrosine kinase
MKLIEEAALRLEALQRSGLASPLPFGEPSAGRAPSDATREAANAPLGRMTFRRPQRTAAAPRRALTLDLQRLQASGHLVSMKSRSLLAEQFRGVKRPLLQNRSRRQPDGRDPSLIMVTSALPGEGKTFCAINLALSLAVEIDLSVLLIDADVVHPQVMARLGAEAEGDRGLLELLSDPKLELADVALRTNVPNLTVLPAGTPNGLSTELLSSGAMEQLLVELSAASADRIVVFDAPPLLLTNEAAVLASHVGQVVVVVEAARTPASAVRQAFELLKPIPVVLSVLNKGRTPQPPKGKGYYYYLEGSA